MAISQLEQAMATLRLGIAEMRNKEEKLDGLKQNGTTAGSADVDVESEVRVLEEFIAANSRQAELSITERFREKTVKRPGEDRRTDQRRAFRGSEIGTVWSARSEGSRISGPACPLP